MASQLSLSPKCLSSICASVCVFVFGMMPSGADDLVLTPNVPIDRFQNHDGGKAYNFDAPPEGMFRTIGVAEGFDEEFGFRRQTEIIPHKFDVVSAGTHPVGLNPYAVQVMEEAGVDISDHVSERVDPYLEKQFNPVMTVCARAQETCPIFPNACKMMHWNFEDPAKAKGTYEQQIIVFPKIRDEIADRIRDFIASEIRA